MLSHIKWLEKWRFVKGHMYGQAVKTILWRLWSCKNYLNTCNQAYIDARIYPHRIHMWSNLQRANRYLLRQVAQESRQDLIVGSTIIVVVEVILHFLPQRFWIRLHLAAGLRQRPISGLRRAKRWRTVRRCFTSRICTLCSWRYSMKNGSRYNSS